MQKMALDMSHLHNDAQISTGCEAKKRSALKGGLEARAGIEPAHKGFADLSLTTWVPRLGRAVFTVRSKSP
jgi:hypothetical protein